MKTKAKVETRTRAKAKVKVKVKTKAKTAIETRASGKTPVKKGVDPKTIDAYLDRLNSDQRKALERIRKIVRATAPRADEQISYRMPAFRLDGKWLVWLGASAKHCAIYGVGEAYEGQLRGYDTSGRGTLRFEVDHPLPAALIRALVKERVAQNAGQKASRKRDTPARAARRG